LYKTEHHHLKSFIAGGVKVGKITLLFVVLFVVALVLPELRSVLFIGGFCLVTGYMVGSQQTARHTAELHANRAERASFRTVEA
jgi:hypothetical protein